MSYFVHGNEYVLFCDQSTANYLMNFRVHFALKTCVNFVFQKEGRAVLTGEQAEFETEAAAHQGA